MEEALRSWVRVEQADLWHDLGEALRYAQNGRWSMAAEGVVCRLVAAIRLVGEVAYTAVPWSLLAGGVYEAVVTLAGAVPALPDEAEWLNLDQVMASHGGKRADLAARWEPTLSDIRNVVPE